MVASDDRNPPEVFVATDGAAFFLRRLDRTGQDDGVTERTSYPPWASLGYNKVLINLKGGIDGLPVPLPSLKPCCSTSY